MSIIHYVKNIGQCVYANNIQKSPKMQREKCRKACIQLYIFSL